MVKLLNGGKNVGKGPSIENSLGSQQENSWPLVQTMERFIFLFLHFSGFLWDFTTCHGGAICHMSAICRAVACLLPCLCDTGASFLKLPLIPLPARICQTCTQKCFHFFSVEITLVNPGENISYLLHILLKSGLQFHF